MKAQPEARIILGGHADERGTREYNPVSERRAAARDYLALRGVNSARVRIIFMVKMSNSRWVERERHGV